MFLLILCQHVASEILLLVFLTSERNQNNCPFHHCMSLFVLCTIFFLYSFVFCNMFSTGWSSVATYVDLLFSRGRSYYSYDYKIRNFIGSRFSCDNPPSGGNLKKQASLSFALASIKCYRNNSPSCLDLLFCWLGWVCGFIRIRYSFIRYKKRCVTDKNSSFSFCSDGHFQRWRAICGSLSWATTWNWMSQL